jgi:hypothetical protein
MEDDDDYEGTSNGSFESMEDTSISANHRAEINLLIGTVLEKMGSRLSRPRAMTAKHVIRLEKIPMSQIAFDGQLYFVYLFQSV